MNSKSKNNCEKRRIWIGSLSSERCNAAASRKKVVESLTHHDPMLLYHSTPPSTQNLLGLNLRYSCHYLFHRRVSNVAVVNQENQSDPSHPCWWKGQLLAKHFPASRSRMDPDVTFLRNEIFEDRNLKAWCHGSTSNFVFALPSSHWWSLLKNTQEVVDEQRPEECARKTLSVKLRKDPQNNSWATVSSWATSLESLGFFSPVTFGCGSCRQVTSQTCHSSLGIRPSLERDFLETPLDIDSWTRFDVVHFVIELVIRLLVHL